MESKFSPFVYRKRFGGWRKAVAHYIGEQAEGLAELNQKAHEPLVVPARSRPLSDVPEAGKGKRVFGSPLNFRELRHEPIDEQGVVFLFGMVARELGFLVESVRSPFPDCRAKRRVKGGNYVEVDIELEFRSSNFREHGHDPSGCDLVVCWVHDWPDCPVEVLELKSAIQQLESR